MPVKFRFLLRKSSFAALLFLGFVRAHAFDCVSSPGPMRERLPDAGDVRTAVFTGRVQGISKDGLQVSLRVIEAFTGPAAGTEIEIESRYAESYRFVVGSSYLVEAFRARPENAWTATTCSHTRALGAASADLVALRAWKQVRRVPCDLKGALWVSARAERRPGLTVRLAGEKRTFQTVTDGEGRFRFYDVPFGTYTMGAVQAGWRVRSVEITSRACPNADLYPSLGGK